MARSARSVRSRVPKQKHVELKKLVKGIKHSGGLDSNYPAEPTLLPLRRFENDRALRSEGLVSTCCGCGLIHLYTYEVFTVDGHWWLAKRSYSLDDLKHKDRRRR